MSGYTDWIMDSDQKYYDLVGRELQDRQLKPGLWARAVAETKSESAEARARYIALRVEELANVDRREAEQRKQEEQHEEQRKKQQELQKLREEDRESRVVINQSLVVLIITAVVILLWILMLR